MCLNKKIKHRREELGLTLQEIGDYVGVSKATVQRYESGEIKNLKLETIKKLSEILKTQPGYLMGWEDKKNNLPFNTIPIQFTNPTNARDYINNHQIFGSDGFNINKMTDDEVLEFANELLKQMELVAYKYKK